MNTFVTETDEKYVQKQSKRVAIIMYIVMSLLACLGLLITWQMLLFLEAIVLFSCIFTYIKTTKNDHNYTLHFEGDVLTITDNSKNERYEVYDIPASDFIINQNKKEKNLDYCSVGIKSTVFAFGGVKKCKELREYIANNYR